MAAPTTIRLGLRLSSHRPTASFFTPSTLTPSKRALSSAAISQQFHPLTVRSKFSALAAQPPPTTSTPSSFFTPSLCRTPIRNASTTAESSPTRATSSGPAPPSANLAMNWNSFFTLRKSRRRYSLISSMLGTLVTTTTSIYLLVEYQDAAESILKLIPTDPFISTGIAVTSCTFLGWLLGPIVGNAVWRIIHRRGMREFVVKERAFFERIKRHRVNPSGAGANNPVPDFYGEKIGSVQGYRRWLKDQRAFNRKRGGDFMGLGKGRNPQGGILGTAP